MSYQLTEDNIKHATLSFLKTYYKNNSSRGFGDTIATLNMKAGDGIIADGYLKFSVNEDPVAGLSSTEAENVVLNSTNTKNKVKETFLATFEATSQGTAEEVQYRVQNSLLFFDALAVASMVAACSYGYNYMNEQYTLNQLGTFKFFAGFFGVMLATTITHILLFRNMLSRYRYIFAIAQFKRYHADEQWVSYGEDVFANSENKYLLELKKQSIRQGFGLIAVDQNLKPNLVITPGRKSNFGTKRKIKQFFIDKTTDKKAFNWVKGMKSPTFKTSIGTKDYTRYTKSFWKQILVMLAMVFVMGEIYLEELKNPNIVYVDESNYEKTLKKATQKNKKEPYDLLNDDEFLIDKYGNKKEIQKIDEEKKSKKSSTTPSIEIKPSISSKKQIAFIISTGIDKYITYDCERLSGVKGNNYLVQIDKVTNSTEAIRQVKNYNKNGFNANALWLGCFSTKNKEYVVYLDDIFTSKNKAIARATEYQKLLFPNGKKKKEPVIRMIRGK